VKGKVYVTPMSVTLNNLKDTIRKAIAKTDQHLLQNFWHEVKYRLDVCMATNEVQIDTS
jgi:hypothetical protein